MKRAIHFNIHVKYVAKYTKMSLTYIDTAILLETHFQTMTKLNQTNVSLSVKSVTSGLWTKHIILKNITVKKQKHFLVSMKIVNLLLSGETHYINMKEQGIEIITEILQPFMIPLNQKIS